ncbi:MAG: hypothetical protein WD009_12785 [Phycisphaeraceae bacterium]
MLVRSTALSLLMPFVAAAAHGAYISEVFVAGPVADAVEITTIDGPARSLDLAVVDATPGRAGDVLAVLTLDLTVPVTLFTAEPWPGQAWSYAAAQPPERVSLDALGMAAALDLAGPRTLMLLEAGSMLSGNRANLFNNPTQRSRLAAATLLDVVTLAPGGALVGYDDELTADPAAGWAISRPRGPHGQPHPELLVGAADDAGWLVGHEPSYRITPGWVNHVHMPEPAAGSLLALGAAAAMLGRRRGCAERVTSGGR